MELSNIELSPREKQAHQRIQDLLYLLYLIFRCFRKRSSVASAADVENYNRQQSLEACCVTHHFKYIKELKQTLSLYFKWSVVQLISRNAQLLTNESDCSLYICYRSFVKFVTALYNIFDILVCW